MFPDETGHVQCPHIYLWYVMEAFFYFIFHYIIYSDRNCWDIYLIKSVEGFCIWSNVYDSDLALTIHLKFSLMFYIIHLIYSHDNVFCFFFFKQTFYFYRYTHNIDDDDDMKWFIGIKNRFVFRKGPLLKNGRQHMWNGLWLTLTSLSLYAINSDK